MEDEEGWGLEDEKMRELGRKNRKKVGNGIKEWEGE